MSDPVQLLAFAGSTRTQSLNKKLVKIAAEGARKAGAVVTVADLRDFAMPLFDEDLESREGPPPCATQLKKLMIASDGFIISSPEYNSSISAVLKNAIDWVSRAAAGERPLAAFSGKTAVLMAASPGALGGLRGLVHLRAILGNLNMIVLPEQRAIPTAHQAFEGDGRLKDATLHESVEALGHRLAFVTRKLKAV
ncbi:MAG: NAD(P)H-dependent oxidoreductase [Phycisphaerae bacterium]|nr:NAD(P)H-dependent oxidoreductase [Phycisphaerae bacterium]